MLSSLAYSYPRKTIDVLGRIFTTNTGLYVDRAYSSPYNTTSMTHETEKKLQEDSLISVFLPPPTDAYLTVSSHCNCYRFARRTHNYGRQRERVLLEAGRVRAAATTARVGVHAHIVTTSVESEKSQSKELYTQQASFPNTTHVPSPHQNTHATRYD